jgi:Kef-type K+ transport system membrane component KefB
VTNFDLSVQVFLVLAVILAAIRAIGALARLLGQPQVVGEMIAGVALGPSLFGLLAPELHASLFPQPVLTVLYCMAQVGLALYMFMVGLELRTDLIRSRIRGAVGVSLAGILAPFALGGLIAAWILPRGDLFTEGVRLGHAVLFLGSAMSITAFPMLARILYERKLTATGYGTLSLAAGSLDDAAAWCLLALVLASFKADPAIAAWAVGGGAGYALAVLGPGRRLLRALGAAVERAGGLSAGRFSAVLLGVMAAAWLTDRMGVYAVFGAFLLGAAMPRGTLSLELERRIGPLTTSLLLPLFFVYSGLQTRIDLIGGTELLAITAVVLLAAILGKGLACGLAARLSGEGWRQSVAIGALMNARGLMELILLNIGLERGLITPALFSILVTMAVATTLMATPIFSAVGAGRGLADSARPVRMPLEAPLVDA